MNYAASSGNDASVDYVAVEWAHRACAENYDLSRMENPNLDPSAVPTKKDGINLEHCIEGTVR